MRRVRMRFPNQRGTLVVQHCEDADGRLILIHGDPAGLRSVGELLLELSELDQRDAPPNDPSWWDVGYSIGLRPGVHIHPQSLRLVAMRLDGRRTGRSPYWLRPARMKLQRTVIETWIDSDAEPVAPPNRRPASSLRRGRVDRAPDSLPAPVVGGGR